MRRVLNISQPIVGANGTMERQFQEWQTLVTNILPYSGTGSPEGVISAPEDSSYYDKSGVAGSVHYIKTKDNIAGDKSRGWVLA